MKVLNGKYDSQLREIVLLHNITKNYLLLGEETDLNFSSYLQPIKEFRDSYDHILRVFRKVLFENEAVDDAYIEKQLSKALGHEYRAFFDVADWFSIVCRKAAYEAIEQKSDNASTLVKQYPRYVECAELINGSGQKIAEIRAAKDVGANIANLVNDYQKLMMEIYHAMLYIKNVAIHADTNPA